MLNDKDLDKLFESKLNSVSFEPDAAAMKAAEDVVDATSSGPLDSLFQKKMSAVNPSAPAESVAAMEKMLNAGKRSAWVKYGVALALLLLGFSAGVMYFSTTSGVDVNYNEGIQNSNPIAPAIIDSDNSELIKGGNETGATPVPSIDSEAQLPGNSQTISHEEPKTSIVDDANLYDDEVSVNSEESEWTDPQPTAEPIALENPSDDQVAVGEDMQSDVINSSESAEVSVGNEVSSDETTEAPSEGSSEDVISASIPPTESTSTGESLPGDENSPNTTMATSEEMENSEDEVNAENPIENTLEAAESETSESVSSEEVAGGVDESEAENVDDTRVAKSTESGEATRSSGRGFDNRKGYNSYFGLMAGVSLAPSFELAESSRPISSTAVLGIRYAYQFRPELTLNINLLYSDRTGINQTVEVHDTLYHFGMSTHSTYITPTRLHYLEFPLYVSWQMDRNHAVLAGFSPALLIGQNNRFDLMSVDSFETRDYQTETHSGRTQGILNYDATVMLGYAYRINRDLAVSVRGQYGLFDITNNEHYQNQRTHRNIWLRLMVEYKLPL